MEFSSILLTTYVDVDSSPQEDERLLAAAVEQAVEFGRHGLYPWTTEHHFRGPWQSNPIQFMTHVAPRLPAETFVGFGVGRCRTTTRFASSRTSTCSTN